MKRHSCFVFAIILLTLFLAGCGNKQSFLDRYFQTVIDEGRSGTDFWCRNADVTSFFSPTRAEVLRSEPVHYNHLHQVSGLSNWRWVDGEQPNYQLGPGAPSNPAVMKGYVTRVHASNKGGQPIVGTYEIYVLEPSRHLVTSPYGTSECLVAIIDPSDDLWPFIRMREMGEIVDAGPQPTPAPASVAPRTTEPPAPRTGEEVFRTSCTACHQASGLGISSAFPPLAEHAADLANASRSYLPLVLVKGLRGQITVKGVTFNGVMPMWGHLGDAEIVNLLNYITSAWGNDARLSPGFEPYNEKDVSDARSMDLASADVLRHRP